MYMLRRNDPALYFSMHILRTEITDKV